MSQVIDITQLQGRKRLIAATSRASASDTYHRSLGDQFAFDTLLDEVARLQAALDQACNMEQKELNELRAENKRLQGAVAALTNELRGICWACKNQKPWKMSVTGDAVACEHLAARGVVAAGGRAGKACTHWAWRGLEGG